MGDEQPADEPKNAWGDAISEERQAELQGSLDRWKKEMDHGNRKGPFDRSNAVVTTQLTGADINWLAEQASLNGDEPVITASNLHLEGARLNGAHLEGAALGYAHLEGADLSGTSFDKTAHLNGAVLTGALLDQVTFDNVNLTVVDWNLVPLLGDEVTAKKAKDEEGKPKDAATRRDEFAAAVRANRVLAVTLRAQGLNEDADKYAYRAQVRQRQVLRQQGKLGRAFGSWLLDVVAGYGYKPMRSIVTYVLVVASFAISYFLLGGAHGQPLSWNESLVVSMTAFHGRGFFGSAFQPGDPQAAVAAVEALVGLLIEITFIATFTQRFFAR
jgi:hypothetical protein